MAEPRTAKPGQRRSVRRGVIACAMIAAIALAICLWLGRLGTEAAAPEPNERPAHAASTAHANDSATTTATAAATIASIAAPATDDTATAGTTTVTADTRIDCASTDASRQILQFLDQQIGATMALLESRGVGKWSRDDQPDLEPSGTSDDGGVKTSGSHGGYADAILKSTADNGDALSAAVFGARLLNQLQRQTRKDDDQQQRDQQLAESQQYLLKGIRGSVRGSFYFLQQLLQQRLDDYRRDVASGKRGNSDTEAAALEQQAWLHVQMRYGSFNERLYAYNVLQRQRLDEAFNSASQHQARDRAEWLTQQLNAPLPQLTADEQAAEQTAREFIDKFVATEPLLERLRCRDGKLVKATLKHEALQQLADRYK